MRVDTHPSTINQEQGELGMTRDEFIYQRRLISESRVKGFTTNFKQERNATGVDDRRSHSNFSWSR